MRVRAKKHLGQHFLADENIAKNIVYALTWDQYNIVLEIGPGMGVLTQFLLAENKSVSVVEIDTESVKYLNEKYNTIHEKLPIYSEDFLKMDLNKLNVESLAIIGNFPYNISSQILFKILDNKNLIPEMVGMFQKEVAERVAANKGNKTYGILSVLIQAYYKVEYLFTVPEHVFNPPPKVKSGVLRISRKETEPDIDKKLLFRVVKAAFNQRRKTLRNALKSLDIPETFKENKILNLRAEQLSVEEFVQLSKVFEK